MDILGIKRPHGITRVSEHINNITEMVSSLMDKKFAYLASDGSIYFDTTKYRKEVSEYPIPNRSSLSHDELIENSNSEILPHKKHVADFALWKATNSDNIKQLGGEWELKLPDNQIILGRPGWHIECSAMCSKMFGETLDVHAGGIDLLCPHHCNEVAQSQAFFHNNTNSTVTQWPNYFFHVGKWNMSN